MNLETKLQPIQSSPQHHADFVTRGLKAIEDTIQSGNGVPSELVMATLDAKLAIAHEQLTNIKNRQSLKESR